MDVISGRTGHSQEPLVQVAIPYLRQHRPPVRRERTGAAQHRITGALRRSLGIEEKVVLSFDDSGEPVLRVVADTNAAGDRADVGLPEGERDRPQRAGLDDGVRVDRHDDLAAAVDDCLVLSTALATVSLADHGPIPQGVVALIDGAQTLVAARAVVDDEDTHLARIVEL